MTAVRRNTISLLLSQGATFVVSLALLLIAPRELGDADFGRLSFAFAYVGFFQLVGLFGTGDFLTKLIAREPNSVGRYVANTLRLKGLASVLLSGLAIGLGLVLGFDRQMLLMVAAFSFGMACELLNNALLGGLQGLQLMGRPAFWGVVRTYTGAAIGIPILLLGGGAVPYAFAFNVVAVIPLVANFLQLRTRLKTGGGLDLSVWRVVVTGGFSFFVLASLLALYGSVDIPMIAAFADSETVGWYALAYRWVSLPAFVAAAVATAFYPALAAEGVQVSDDFRHLANRALHFVVFIATPTAVGIGAIAPTLVEVFYGGAFEPSVPLMRLLAIHIPVVALDVVLGMVAISADRQKQWIVYAAIAAVFNPLANLVAIPLAMQWFDNAAIGAAFTTVLTEFILAVGAFRLRPRGVFERDLQLLVARIGLASLAILPVVLALRSTPLALQIGAGVVTYAAMSLILRTVSKEDVRRLVQDMTRRRAQDVVTTAPEPAPEG
jgi:O-antigen/teichoic acid export membrane protein